MSTSKKYKIESTGQFVDPITYSLKVMNEAGGNVKIYIGTDSQNLRRKTCYCTAICFHFSQDDGMGKGVHVIYYKELVPKIKDHFTRLWNESQKSIEIAEALRDKCIMIERIDLDYNDDEYWYSNRLVAAGKGMVQGLGYKCAVKPDELLATRAADHAIRR